MNTRKYNNMMATYTGFKGTVTMGAVSDQIPATLKQRLTGAELGLVMSAVNNAYHNGRASHGGVDVLDDCVWLPWGGGLKTECGACQTQDPDKCRCVDKIGQETGQLVPIAALRKIQITDTDTGGQNYALDYTEKENL